MESGNRLGTLDNSEGDNRITTDYLKMLSFCAPEDALDRLKREELKDCSYCMGNIMLLCFPALSRFSMGKHTCVVFWWKHSE